MKKCVYTVIVTILVIVIGVIITMFLLKSFATNKISLIESQSYYSDFEVKGDKVYIKCYITLKNTYDTERTVKLCASFPDDVTIGLLKNEILYPMDENNNIIEFNIEPKDEKSYEVVFVGDYAGTNKKHDRNLPPITIESME